MLFKKLLDLFWPIQRHELIKLMPMMAILFLLGFIQSSLWGLKDSLIVTAMGAEVIAFIKVWAILPAMVSGAWIFAWSSKRFGFERTFYFLIGSFLVLTALFAFVAYPYREQLQWDTGADALETALLPGLPGLKGFVSMIRHWPLTCFYVVCELSYTIMITDQKTT